MDLLTPYITLFLTVYAGMKIHVVLIADYCKKKKRETVYDRCL